MILKACFVVAIFGFASFLAMVFDCQFEVVDTYYTCVVLPRSAVYTKTAVLNKVNGTHMVNETIATVIAVVSSNVNFTYLPAMVGKIFVGMEIFKIENAGLKLVKKDNLAGMEKIGEFSFMDNLIESLEPGLFYANTGMLRLRLSGNRIKRLPPQFFLPLEQLREVYMDRNLLESLDADLFKTNEKLTRLSMRDNKLKRINTDFVDLKQLNQIYFDNNTCTNLTFFIQVMTMHDFQRLLRSTCVEKKVIKERYPEFDW